MSINDTPDDLETLEKYGPKVGSNIGDIETTTALAAGKKPRSQDEMVGRNLMALAGRPEAIEANQRMLKDARELGNQYKRETRDKGVKEDSTIEKLRRSLGFKHGGKISTAEKNKTQRRW